MIEIQMPNAPSVNWLYAGNGRVRYKSKVYKAWIKLVDNTVDLTWLSVEPNKALQVSINMQSEWFNKGNGKIKIKDIGNFQKAILDYLNDNLEWFEDECVFSLLMFKCYNTKLCSETTTIKIDYL